MHVCSMDLSPFCKLGKSLKGRCVEFFHPTRMLFLKQKQFNWVRDRSRFHKIVSRSDYHGCSWSLSQHWDWKADFLLVGLNSALIKEYFYIAYCVSAIATLSGQLVLICTVTRLNFVLWGTNKVTSNFLLFGRKEYATRLWRCLLKTDTAGDWIFLERKSEVCVEGMLLNWHILLPDIRFKFQTSHPLFYMSKEQFCIQFWQNYEDKFWAVHLHLNLIGNNPITFQASPLSVHLW